MGREHPLKPLQSKGKGTGDALDRCNYRGFKLTDQVMKALELVLDIAVRQSVDIHEIRFDFVSGKGTTDSIFIARQMQENYVSVRKLLNFAFIDLENAIRLCWSGL